MKSKDSKFYPGIAREVFGTRRSQQPEGPDRRDPRPALAAHHHGVCARAIPARQTRAVHRHARWSETRRTGHDAAARARQSHRPGTRARDDRHHDPERRRRCPGQRTRSRIRHAVRQVRRVHRSRSAAARGKELRRQAHARSGGRAAMGCSSGAAAAFSMAWFHPSGTGAS